MTLEELENYMRQLPEEILSQAAEIVAETAVESFKGSFSRKAFDGNPWAPAKTPKKKGSLLITSGELLNSVRPDYVGTDRVVIAAGNGKVDYAKVQNEGFTGNVTVPEHTRHTRYGAHKVKTHTRSTNIPARPFMGNSSEVIEEIHKRIEDFINHLK
jgi:phage gpG-like protein